MVPEGFPSLIFITGADGTGKSSVTQCLLKRLQNHGLQAMVVWSRFNNFLSKPLLGLTRVTGHNYYRKLDGILFGFHNFENLYGYRYLFALLQAIDVNIATYLRITKFRAHFDCLIAERGPWDSLVDVISDTGLTGLLESVLGRLFVTQIRNGATVILINRSKDNILSTRPELIHDYKLDQKINIYHFLAKRYGWKIVDNNKSFEVTQKQIDRVLQLEVASK